MRTTAEWLAAVGGPEGAEALRQAEAAAQYPEDWLRIAEHHAGDADRERARVAVLRAVDASIDRYVVHSPAVHRSAELLAKRLGDREGAAEVLRRLERGLARYGSPWEWGHVAKSHQTILGDEASAERCLAFAERRADSPEGLAQLASSVVECGRPRERAVALLERAEAAEPVLVGRALSSLMSAWRSLGEGERALCLLERVSAESEDCEVLRGAASSWWWTAHDEAGARRALLRAESYAKGAEAWLALAEDYRDGGESERPAAWDPSGVRRCLEQALASEPSPEERAAIAAAYRRWLGDHDAAAALAEDCGEREPRARVRAGLELWDTSRPLELFEHLRDRLDPDDIEELATAQSHQDVARHLQGLEEILSARRLELPLLRHPYGALESASWDSGERTNHLARAFACTLLLLDGTRNRCSDTMPVLLESAWQLELDERLERFLAWLAEVLPIHELGWALLGLALCTARRDPSAPVLAKLVESMAMLSAHHSDGCVDPDWVYPAEYGIRKALWAQLVDEALASAEDAEVERLRSLLSRMASKSTATEAPAALADVTEATDARAAETDPGAATASDGDSQAASTGPEAPAARAPEEAVWHWVRYARDECRKAPEERDRALAEAARLAVTAKDLVQVAHHLGWLGGDRTLGRALAERGEALTIEAGDHRGLWSVAIAWKQLGEEARARAALELGVESTRDTSVAVSLSTAWRSLFDDDTGVRRALARAEVLASSASQWLSLAESNRDGGNGDRVDSWDREGTRRCLEAALLANPSEEERVAVANGFRQWLGDEERADSIAMSGRTHEEVPRLRQPILGVDGALPSELWDSVVAMLDDAELEHIAAADYGQGAAKNLAALRTMVATKRVPQTLPWHPQEVVSLTRWQDGPRTHHRARAFACLVLLLGDADALGVTDALGPLIESARVLGLDEALERYLVWLSEVLPIGQLGWAVLALALCIARRDPSSPSLATLVDKLESLRKPRRDWPRGRWAYPEERGLRRALWAQLVDEALAGAKGPDVERLRALLGQA